MDVDPRVADRFWSMVSPEPNTGCWLWTGSWYGKGYGRLWVAGECFLATHLSLALHGRALSPWEYALHNCDNPPCVNPDHLFAGTLRDNMRDCVAKGRAAGGSGRQKLSKAWVAAIMARTAAGETYESIAKDIGIGSAMVGHVVQRVRYGNHVLNP